MIAFAHWHFSEMQPPRPHRGGHPSDGGEFNHPDRLAAAPPTQFLRWAMSGVQTRDGWRAGHCRDVQLVTLRVSRTSLPYKTTLHPKKTLLFKRSGNHPRSKAHFSDRTRLMLDFRKIAKSEKRKANSEKKSLDHNQAIK